MAVAAAAGFMVALVDYLVRGSGIDHTGGALLVTLSSAVLFILGVALARGSVKRQAWRVLLIVLAIIDVLGTGVAAYFLHAWWLLAFMALAVIGWAVLSFAPDEPAQTSHRSHGAPA